MLIAFPDSTLPEEYRLGYAHQWLVDGRVCRVVVRNATFHPTTFTWTLTGSSDAFADWDLTESGAPP